MKHKQPPTNNHPIHAQTQQTHHLPGHHFVSNATTLNAVPLCCSLQPKLPQRVSHKQSDVDVRQAYGLWLLCISWRWCVEGRVGIDGSQLRHMKSLEYNIKGHDCVTYGSLDLMVLVWNSLRKHLLSPSLMLELREDSAIKCEFVSVESE